MHSHTVHHTVGTPGLHSRFPATCHLCLTSPLLVGGWDKFSASDFCTGSHAAHTHTQDLHWRLGFLMRLTIFLGGLHSWEGLHLLGLDDSPTTGVYTLHAFTPLSPPHSSHYWSTHTHPGWITHHCTGHDHGSPHHTAVPWDAHLSSTSLHLTRLQFTLSSWDLLGIISLHSFHCLGYVRSYRTHCRISPVAPPSQTTCMVVTRSIFTFHVHSAPGSLSPGTGRPHHKITRWSIDLSSAWFHLFCHSLLVQFSHWFLTAHWIYLLQDTASDALLSHIGTHGACTSLSPPLILFTKFTLQSHCSARPWSCCTSWILMGSGITTPPGPGCASGCLLTGFSPLPLGPLSSLHLDHTTFRTSTLRISAPDYSILICLRIDSARARTPAPLCICLLCTINSAVDWSLGLRIHTPLPLLHHTFLDLWFLFTEQFGMFSSEDQTHCRDSLTTTAG